MTRKPTTQHTRQHAQPAGGVKGYYSDTFAHFADPLMDGEMSLAERRRRFDFALLAWNLGTLPPDQRITALMDILRNFPPQDRLEMKQEMGAWVERKLQLFGTCQWFIESFELREDRNRWYLTVLARVVGPSDPTDYPLQP
jgi:hypothetical protein